MRMKEQQILADEHRLPDELRHPDGPSRPTYRILSDAEWNDEIPWGDERPPVKLADNASE